MVKFEVNSKTDKTCPIRSNFDTKQVQCIDIQVINSYAI